MKKFLAAAAAVVVMGWAGTAGAATLTIQDFGKSGALDTTWTLTIATGCTTCAVTLQAVFESPTEYAGKYLDSVQWQVDSYNIAVGGIGFVTGPGTPVWSLANLNANQCGGGSGQGACGAMALPGIQIVAGSTLTWTFQTTFVAQLPTALGLGNIRAAYNDADGKNYNIFSPSGGTFTGGGGTGGGGTGGGGTVPEPGAMMLLGSGLVALAAAVRRRS